MQERIYYYWYRFWDGSSFVSLELSEERLAEESKKRRGLFGKYLA